MLSALVYLQYHTITNRTTVRLRRLKQPKYLLGAIVGGLYFYFYFFRYLFGVGSGRRPAPVGADPGDVLLYQGIGAAVFFLLVLLGWLLPRERRLALIFVNVTDQAQASTDEMSGSIKIIASAIEELTSSVSEIAKSAERAAGVARAGGGCGAAAHRRQAAGRLRARNSPTAHAIPVLRR